MAFLYAFALSCAALFSGDTMAADGQSPGVSDKEIKIGQTMPYSGPASAYGTIGRTHLAYFRMVNENGGIAGRKIKLISLDDAYSPPKTVEHVRRLVEQDEVLLLFQPLGTASNIAVHRYLNERKVPHLLVASGFSRWSDPKRFPWTIGFNASYRQEAESFAKYVLANRPKARIAVLYQNDDLGKDYLHGLRAGLGNRAEQMVVMEQSFNIEDPSVDSQVIALKNSGADVFANIATPKAAAQAIRKAFAVGWRPLQFIPEVANSIETVLKPAGVEKAVGAISFAYYKDPVDPQWRSEQETQNYLSFMRDYYPRGDAFDSNNVYGYIAAELLVEILSRCGDDLTRANVMRQATNLRDVRVPMMLPGMSITTGPDDYRIFRQLQALQFDGERWVPLGGVISERK
jgi:ABC-type branched-subunit amino acid transport system substrate-binding protein